jgi:hypothetical protein
MAKQVEQDPIVAEARRCLGSAFLAERAARIGFLADWIAGFSELRDLACNRRAVQAAAWFHDAWCCEDLRAGRFAAPLVLAVQPTELQRERAADIAFGALRGVVDDATCVTAARAIREAGLRDTRAPEAHILGEAVNLDSIGPLWLWGQIARCAVEDRTAASVVAAWERHVEYRYWPKRIDETLRFERSRRLARERCKTLDACFAALRDQLSGGDNAEAPERRDG